MSLTTVNRPEAEYFVGDTIEFNITLKDWFGMPVNASEQTGLDPLDGLTIIVSGSGGTQYSPTVRTDAKTGLVLVSRRVTMEGTYFFEIKHHESKVQSFTDTVKPSACKINANSNACEFT